MAVFAATPTTALSRCGATPQGGERHGRRAGQDCGHRPGPVGVLVLGNVGFVPRADMNKQSHCSARTFCNG